MRTATASLLALGLLLALATPTSAPLHGGRSLPVPSPPAMPTPPQAPSAPGGSEVPFSEEVEAARDIYESLGLVFAALGYLSAFWSGRKIANVRNDLRLFQRRFSDRFPLFKKQVNLLISIPVAVTGALAVAAILVKKLGKKAATADDPMVVLVTIGLMAVGFVLFHRINQKSPDKFRTRKAKRMMKFVGRAEGAVQSIAPGVGSGWGFRASPRSPPKPAEAHPDRKPPQAAPMEELRAEFVRIARLRQQGRISEAEFIARRDRLGREIQRRSKEPSR